MRLGAQFKIPNSDAVRRPPCKYRTKSKKLLQNKNRFLENQKAVFMVFSNVKDPHVHL